MIEVRILGQFRIIKCQLLRPLTEVGLNELGDLANTDQALGSLQSLDLEQENVAAAERQRENPVERNQSDQIPSKFSEEVSAGNVKEIPIWIDCAWRLEVSEEVVYHRYEIETEEKYVQAYIQISSVVLQIKQRHQRIKEG